MTVAAFYMLRILTRLRLLEGTLRMTWMMGRVRRMYCSLGECVRMDGVFQMDWIGAGGASLSMRGTLHDRIFSEASALHSKKY